jgi:replicative DNA helicase
VSSCQSLRDLERERAEEAGPMVRELRSRREVLEERRKKLVKTAGTAKDAEARTVAEAELSEVDEALAGIGNTALSRMLADDLTPEALGGLLAKHGRIAVLAAESAFLDNLSGRYSENGANLHLLCSAYSGEATMIDRRNRDPEMIDRPLCTVALTVQPHVIAALVEHPVARAQGLVARFAYSIPVTQLGRRNIDAAVAPAEIHTRWAECVRRVADNADKTPISGVFVSSVNAPVNTKSDLYLSRC